RDVATARRDSGAVPGHRDAPPQICLPGLRAGGGSGAGAGTADQGRAADRGDGGLCPGCQIRLASTALSARPDASRARPRHQAPGRGAVHALKLLEHYRGIVQCDGYAAYKSIADAACGEAITLAFCWAHLRRRFFDIAKDGSAPIASEALERIAALYAIEKTI